MGSGIPHMTHMCRHYTAQLHTASYSSPRLGRSQSSTRPLLSRSCRELALCTQPAAAGRHRLTNIPSASPGTTRSYVRGSMQKAHANTRLATRSAQRLRQGFQVSVDLLEVRALCRSPAAEAWLPLQHQAGQEAKTKKPSAVAAHCLQHSRVSGR